MRSLALLVLPAALPLALTPVEAADRRDDSEPFECVGGSAGRQAGWSEGQKAWCCLHEGIGCSPTTSAAAKEDLTPSDSCSSQCAFNGTVSDCSKHLQMAAALSKLVAGASCETAVAFVVMQCPSCQACSAASKVLCSTPSATTDATLAPQRSGDSEADGDTHNCSADAKEWMAKWSYAKVSYCCSQKEKPPGVACPKGSLRGRSESAAEPKLNCTRERASWSQEEAAWCCFHQGIACLDPGAPTPAPDKPHNCSERKDSWEKDWQEGKKAWCCLYESVGCSPAEHDCQEGIVSWRESWPPQKKAWCCKSHHLGCDQGEGDLAVECQGSDCHSDNRATKTAFDCGNAEESSGWPGDQQAWCCESEGVGCRPDPEEAFDCQALLAHWQQWDVQKQEWCCLTKQKGCLGPSAAAGLPKVEALSSRLYSDARLGSGQGRTQGRTACAAAVGALAAAAGLAAVRVVSRSPFAASAHSAAERPAPPHAWGLE